MRHGLREQREIHPGGLNSGAHLREDSFCIGFKCGGERRESQGSRFFSFNSMAFIHFPLSENRFLTISSLSNKGYFLDQNEKHSKNDSRLGVGLC